MVQSPKPQGDRGTLKGWTYFAFIYVGLCSLLLAAIGCGADSRVSETADVSPSVSRSELAGSPSSNSSEVYGAYGERAKDDGRPNVVWIVLDAARAKNMSTFGYSRETTPNITRLAARGATFERCYSQANGTALSVPSYMTGRYFPVLCLSSGTWRSLYRTPSPEEQLFPDIARENGYLAVAFTAHPWFSPGSRIFSAFDNCNFVPSIAGRAYAEFEEINAAIFEWLDAVPTQPFFLYVHTMDTHLPHYIKEEHDAWIDREYAANPDPTVPYSDAHKAMMRGLYDGSFHYADAEVGRLMDKLESMGLLDSTIFVISSDHGECIGEDGYTIDHPGMVTVEELFHVPLVIAGQDIPDNVRVSALAQNADIVPTLVDVLRLETNAEFDGKSLMPLFGQERAERVHDYVAAYFPGGDDESLEWVMLHGSQFRTEYHPNSGNGILWKLPDSLGERQDLTGQYPTEIAERIALAKSELLPLWKRYTSLPRSSPRPFPLEISPVFAVSEAGFTDKFDMYDNKWACNYLNLISTSMHEDCPPITFQFDVPNGEYKVQMELLPKDTGSAFLVQAEDDAAAKLVISTRSDKMRDFLDLGVYRITDESFDVTLQEGNDVNSARMSSFRFIPIVDGKEVVSAESQDKLNEQLDSLGYL